MPSYSLAPGIGFCRFDDCTIVLDTHRDRYWQMAPEVGALLDQQVRYGQSGITDGRLEPLIGLGLLVRGAPATVPPMLPVPRRSLLEEVDSQPGGPSCDVLEIGWLMVVTRARLRFRRLDRVLTDYRRARRQRGHETAALAELVRRFESARGLVPLAPRCLADTLAWLAFIGRRGYAAALVFGVRPDPFQAHCWAQSGDVVLNDALDHARRFSPILVV